MPIELAKIQLHRVHRIKTLEQSVMIHHQVPGLEGNLTQNLGRDSVWLQIEGIFYGPKAADNLEVLRSAYQQREPVDFLAEAVGQAYFSQVILERLEVVQSAELPDQFSYRLTIAEYVSAKQSTDANQAIVNQAIKQQAQDLMSLAALPDALSLGLLPELTNPVDFLFGAISQMAAALEPSKAATNELQAAFQLETTATPIQPSSQRSQPTSLKWQGEQPSLAELIAAGLPPQYLGVTEETALRMLGTQTSAVSRWIALSVEADPSVIDQQPFEIRDGSGSVVFWGRFDDQGKAVIPELEAGEYTLVLPQLMEDDWTMESG